ncbi:hypothetical protein [Salinisphaera sp. T31B1]|uniref:hypothetical protein n=1 Tax=Salinisphaera sp. T31B1 TaxID=727963 RepID=UPI0033425B18
MRSSATEVRFNADFDARLSNTGRVDADDFARFRQAHTYGTAPPMNWLIGKLALLRERLDRQAALALYEPSASTCVVCHEPAVFEDWVQRHFPDALA